METSVTRLGPEPSIGYRPASGAAVLSVQDLWVEYWTPRGAFTAVRGATFDLHPGESLALIGESGSGKTTLALALILLLPRAARLARGRIAYQRDNQQVEVLALGDERLRRFRWEECAMVFQGALNVLNPVLTVRDQFVDTYRAHQRERSRAIEARARDLLRMVQLDAERVLRAYPHELSGGMRQRVLIALSLLLSPQILILDEPTTALDILTQRAIMDLLRRLKDELGFATIFISHDLSLAAELADRVATMYAGRLVEVALVRKMFYSPAHPYTAALLDSMPTVVGGVEAISAIPGSPPDLRNPPPGCPFHPRCAYAVERCKEAEVPVEPVDAGHDVSCIRWRDVRRDRRVRPTAAPAG